MILKATCYVLLFLFLFGLRWVLTSYPPLLTEGFGAGTVTTLVLLWLASDDKRLL